MLEGQQLDELDGVLAYRENELRKLGLPPDDALQLSRITDARARAQELVDAGCDPRTAARILQPDAYGR